MSNCLSNWCPEGNAGSSCPLFNQFHAAGPAELTGNYNIGDRKCIKGLKRCQFGTREWCTAKSDCSLNQFKPPAAPYDIYGATYMPNVAMKKYTGSHNKYGYDSMENYKPGPQIRLGAPGGVGCAVQTSAAGYGVL